MPLLFECVLNLSLGLNIEDPPFVVNDLLLNCISRTLDGRWLTGECTPKVVRMFADTNPVEVFLL